MPISRLDAADDLLPPGEARPAVSPPAAPAAAGAAAAAHGLRLGLRRRWRCRQSARGRRRRHYLGQVG